LCVFANILAFLRYFVEAATGGKRKRFLFERWRKRFRSLSAAAYHRLVVLFFHILSFVVFLLLIGSWLEPQSLALVKKI